MASWAFRKKVLVPHKMVMGLHKKAWEPHTTVQETHKMEREHHKRRKEHHGLSLACRSLTMGLHMMTREIRRIHSGELALKKQIKCYGVCVSHMEIKSEKYSENLIFNIITHVYVYNIIILYCDNKKHHIIKNILQFSFFF